ncbi:Uncharacterised protein [Candidatus Bilamarchaeum dharawalense]|uniref:Uncharacterized protein n=1 Tax=Candidatus Bilamarchaeum dharawalense TaxID=2885759 RepID=A0A5E4LMV9_9ARCH|nr:Uncharacterised protein [Candidatus Bilamarchaeum dharawalense]
MAGKMNICPKCGDKTKVPDTGKRSSAFLCRKCGHSQPWFPILSDEIRSANLISTKKVKK